MPTSGNSTSRPNQIHRFLKLLPPGVQEAHWPRIGLSVLSIETYVSREAGLAWLGLSNGVIYSLGSQQLVDEPLHLISVHFCDRPRHLDFFEGPHIAIWSTLVFRLGQSPASVQHVSIVPIWRIPRILISHHDWGTKFELVKGPSQSTMKIEQIAPY